MGSKTTNRPTTSGAQGLGPTGAKDIYLLVRPELIRATLKGQKWQTRRLCKLRGILPEFVGHPGEEDQPIYWEFPGLGLGPDAEEPVDMDWLMEHPTLGPYGKPGDLAVVREAVGCNDEYPVHESLQLHRTGAGLPNGPLEPYQLEFWQKYVVYRASTPEPPYLVNGWRSPLHMPRWAARIVRPITEIRIERVAEISEADAEAEGLTRLTKDGGQTYKWGIPDRDGLPGNDDEGWHWKQWDQDPRQAYRRLWNSINAAPKPRYGREGGKKVVTHYEAFPWSLEDFDALCPGARKAGTWKSKPLTVCPNPFVWVVSFEREDAPHA